ncbi:MAG TPA: hypothetical protein VFN77_05085, partial [Acetobacteraceae bacterium]|nr:hypothetical protein [Acetobacteraceae bacterium]
ARGSVPRALGLGLLLLVLAGPQWQIRTGRPERDIALLVRDQSPSMAINGRRALANAAYSALLASRPPNTELRTVTVPRGANGTPLIGAIRRALADIPENRLSGVVAVTDGEATDAGSLPLKAPFSMLIPARGNQTDRELRLLAAPRYGIVGHHVTLRFEVLDHGVSDRGKPVPVRISVDGARAVPVNAHVGQPAEFRMKVRHAGAAIVAVQAQALPGEVSTLNDQAVFTLNGVRRRLSVLLISGRPSQGLRIWRLLLKSDPAIRLINFTILRNPDEPLDAPLRDLALIPFPIEQLFVDDIGKFDLIILDQFSNEGLLPPEYLGNIANRVRAGGALLVEAGPEYEQAESLAGTPIAPVLPALPSGPGTVTAPFKPALTRYGRRHPVTSGLAGIPAGDWYRWETATARKGVTLLRAPGKAPLLVLAHEGKGRVAMLLSDQFWLWARGALGGDTAMSGPAIPLLRRTVHWLLQEPALAANRLTASIVNGRLVVRRRVLRGKAAGAAVITAPGGGTRGLRLVRLAPGLYGGSIPANAAGVWAVRAAGQVAYAAIGMNDPLEYRDLAANSRRLGPMARASGGRIVWLKPGGAPKLASLLRPRHAEIITGTRDVPLLPAAPVAALALILLGWAWWRER